MKYLKLTILCCLLSGCGTFGGSYTSQSGATYQAKVTIPNRVTADAK